MTVPAHVLAAVRSIPHPRQEPTMTAPAPSPAEQAVVDRFGIFEPEKDAERVARALWTADVAGSVSYTWHDVSEGAQRKWLRLAAAALAAMQPTAAEEADRG